MSTATVTADAEEAQGVLPLALLALLVGAVTGFVAATFRLALGYAEQLRVQLVHWAHAHGAIGFVLLVASCAGATLLAAALVRRCAPLASGSGIPYVEAVLRAEIPPASYALLPVKYVGGLLAIGAGLALGREGPSVQMGAAIAQLCGRIFRRRWLDCRALLAAGAGAGLATAFNAPIAGAIFVLEELVQRFERRTAIAALAASATAIAVARQFLGDSPDFHLSALPYLDAEGRLLSFVLGALAGLLAIAYNATILATSAAAARFSVLAPELRAALVGGVVGILAWLVPDLVGGGDAITERVLAGNAALALLPLAFLLRFGLGAASYAAGTPGGLFAPLLVLGAQAGLMFGVACHWAIPGFGAPSEAFAVIGMAAFFAGVVRAPLTGIALVLEMTGNVTMLLPALGACASAMLIPTLARQAPIYESLRQRLVREASGV